MSRFYHGPAGGLPDQSTLHEGRAVFTQAYAFIPKGVMTDIVTSNLPFWESTRAWILARPMTGFSETFSQYLMETDPQGGSERPEPYPDVEGVLFVVEGELTVTLGDGQHRLGTGGYAYLPPRSAWTVRNHGQTRARYHWIRKPYAYVEGLDLPEAIFTSDDQVAPIAMPGTEGRWATTRFVDPSDLRHDMHVNIVTFAPGAVIPFEETHVMEHGLFVLEGKAVYRLNRDWVEVAAGDFMWLRAFCPQAC
ncbi:Ureidoglycine aminohydrolase [Methylorubrum populi]|uniref:Ureidoglycine aminohydrolase n=1 Tax=Methylorubrum populi TaxID=223967 RepID=A0A833J002_9HYPH|nr:Ureidoglycine aminohydrolase [Methylorubrum populi]